MVAKILMEFKLVGNPVSKSKVNSLHLQECFIQSMEELDYFHF